MPIDLKATTAIPAGVRAALGLPISVKLYGAVGDGVADDYDAVRSALDATPLGGTLYFPPGTYLLSEQLEVDRSVHLTGTRSRVASSTPLGSVLRPFDATAQTGMDALVKVTEPYASLNGLAFYGRSTSNSCGVLFEGTIAAHSHGSKMRDCIVQNFAVGVTLGAYSDHITIADGCEITSNADGVFIAADNHNDYAFIDSILAGNTRASVFIEEDIGVTNLSFLRTHLGFSQYGILQDTASDSGAGISCMTLLDSPIESVTVQHINVRFGGNIRVIGGYWHWSGTPAQPACYIGTVNYGPVRIGVEFVNANASATAVVQVANYTNFPVNVEGDIGSFAAVKYAGNVVPPDHAKEWVPCTALIAAVGGPAFSTTPTGEHVVLVLDDSTTEVVSSTFMPPPEWESVKVSVVWTNPNAGSGDVFWQSWDFAVVDAASLARNNFTNVTATAPAQNVVEVTQLRSAMDVTPGVPHEFAFGRLGAQGADTLTGDAAVLGLLLERVA